MFCPAATHPRTSVYSAFCAVNAVLYHQRSKTAHMALRRLFLRFYPLHHPRYQTGTSGYNTARATLEHTHAPKRPPAHTRYQHHAGRCTAQRNRPIIIKYIRVRSVFVIDPCQTVQHIADHASPAGQPSSRGAAGGAEPLAATAVSLFGLSPDSQ